MGTKVAKVIVRFFIKPSIIFYKKAISPFLGQRCRFNPTCSEYSLEAFETHGLIKGAKLSLIRILCCQPFCKRFGHDPVPKP